MQNGHTQAQTHPRPHAPVVSLDGAPVDAKGPRLANGAGARAEPREPEPQCCRCRTEFSPLFHEVPFANGAGPSSGGGGAPGRSWLCHKCYADARKANFPVMLGVGAA